MRLPLRSICLAFSLWFTQLAWGQLNQRTEQRPEGSYTRTYHTNGNLSTEVFRPTNLNVFRFGFSRAFGQDGRKIYERSISHAGMSATVTYSYYTNGAVRTAVYRTVPEGSLQWESETTNFDMNGMVTGVQKDSYSQQPVVPQHDPGKPSDRYGRHHHVRHVDDKDSVIFFRTYRNVDPTGHLVTEKRSYPADGYTQTDWKVVDRVTRSRVEFFRKPGIQTIERIFHDNGRLREETIYEENVRHYRMWDEEGSC